VTSHDYHVTMKTVGVADLKARLSEHLRSVRKGRALTVVDRNTPIAQLIPISEGPIETRAATRSARDLPRPTPALPAGTSSLALLLEDRGRR
jgi:prevent-host-death family protein